MSRGLVFAVRILAVAWLAGAVPNAGAQKMHKWIDEDGKVHFSNISPGDKGATTEESSGSSPQDTEAQSPVTAPPAPIAPERSTDNPEISDDAFSSKVSSTRSRLKRELAQAKEQAQAADEKLSALKKERDQQTGMGLEILQKAYGPERHAPTEEEQLGKQKASAEKRIQDIRKQYGDLHDEAVKRFGGQPSWWLRIE